MLSHWLGLALISFTPMIIAPSYAETVPVLNFTTLDIKDSLSQSPYGISADGSVIVGSLTDDDPNNWMNATYRAYRWTKAGGVQDLGTMGGISAYATGVSANGSVIVGGVKDTNGNYHAYRWTKAGGVQDLGTMGGRSATASAVSINGSVIVGSYTNDDPKNFVDAKFHVYRWTQVGGVQDIGTMGGISAQARGVSANGSVIVGWFKDTNGNIHAYRWTEANGVKDLGTMGGKSAYANGVSADGTIIIGTFMLPNGGGTHIYRWTQADGIQDLGDMGVRSLSVNSVSANGLLILGFYIGTKLSNYRPQYYLARLDSPSVPAIASTEPTSNNPETLPSDEEAKYQNILATGHPAQIYTLAIKMQSESHPDHAAKLYQVLIDRFPDSNYTAKAIDKMETGVPQHQTTPQQPTQQQMASNQHANEQHVASCKAQCDLTFKSCKSQVSSLRAQSVANVLLGSLGKNIALTQQGIGQAGASDQANCYGQQQACYGFCQ